MSLIQEALKRQQEEAGKPSPAESDPPARPTMRIKPKTVSTTTAPPENFATGTAPKLPIENDVDTDYLLPGDDAPSAPELRLRSRTETTAKMAAETRTGATPDDDDAEGAGRVRSDARPERHHNPVLPLLGILILMLLLLAGGGWAVLHGLQMLRRQPEPPPRTDVPAALPPVADTPVVPDELPVAAPPLVVPDDLAPDLATVPPVVTDPAPPDEAATVAETPLPAEPDPVVATKPPAEMPVETPDTDAIPPPPDSVIWPFLRVTGIVGGGHSGSALINDQIVEVGTRIEGVRLLGISGQAVRLEYRGEQRLVRAGRSTE